MRQAVALHRWYAAADNSGMGLVCMLGAVILLKLQLDETPVWVYLLSIQLVIMGLLIIALDYDAFIHV